MAAPRVEVLFRRPPDGVERYDHELLHDGEEVKISLLQRSGDAPALTVGAGTRIEGGASLLWFVFPGRGVEVGSFYDASGRHLGYYTNLIRRPDLEERRWEITDLFLDVWQPAGDGLEVLDRDELERAEERGWIAAGEAERVRRRTARIVEEARSGGWPPEPVRRWTLEAIPTLRMRRDEPGIHAANVVATRIIGFGIYLLGAVSITSLGFGVSTDALDGPGPARTAWSVTLAAEAVLLLLLALAGRLPATRRVRPRHALSEETLFLGAAVASVAVLLVNESGLWRSLLSAVYGTLALFLAIFVGARSLVDRRFPALALAGLALCALALVILL